MKFTILAVFLVTLMVAVAPAAATDWITNPANGHNYRLTSTPNLTWTEAEAEAISLGGHLATIRNTTEDQWIRTTFGTNWWWIGLSDTTSEGTFVWTSGEPVPYFNWNAGEPNNQNNEDFVGMNIDDTRGWNDFPDWYRMYGIVETVPVPEPTGLLGLASSLALLGLARRRKL